MVITKLIEEPLKEIDLIIKLDQNFFPYPWGENSWQNLDWSRYSLFGLYLNQALIGFALFYRIPEENLAHLLKILVDPEFRGQKYAQDLWRTVEQRFRAERISRIILEVAEDNFSAIGFYKKLGFESLNLIKGYYSDQKAAICYEKKMHRAGE